MLCHEQREVLITSLPAENCNSRLKTWQIDVKMVEIVTLCGGACVASINLFLWHRRTQELEIHLFNITIQVALAISILALCLSGETALSWNFIASHWQFDDHPILNSMHWILIKTSQYNWSCCKKHLFYCPINCGPCYRSIHWYL